MLNTKEIYFLCIITKWTWLSLLLALVKTSKKYPKLTILLMNPWGITIN
jgi:hypothetical protein